MRRLVALGILLALVAVGYATASGRMGLNGLFDRFRSSQRLPSLKSQDLPFHYPARLWQSGVKGEVLLKIHITAAGTVDSVELQRSSGEADLDTIAVQGARQLRYHPARQGENAVAIWALLPVRFEHQSVSATTEGK